MVLSDLLRQTGRGKNKATDNLSHIAIIFSGNRVVYVGRNYYNNNDVSIHAEDHAYHGLVQKIRAGLVKNSRFSILVVRVGMVNGVLTYSMSKPCCKCQNLLKNQSLIKKVYWSVDNYYIDSCKVNNL